MPDGTTVPKDRVEMDKPAQKLADLKVGGLDQREQEVLAIFWTAEHFKIYKTDYGLGTMLSDDKARAEVQRKDYLALGADISEFKGLLETMRPLPVPFSKRELPTTPAMRRSREHYERELSRCIASALSGEVDLAKTSLAQLKQRLAVQSGNRGRIFHLFVSLILTTLFVAAGIAVAYKLTDAIFGFLLHEMTIAVMMGSLGALFSTSVRLRSMDVDPAAGVGMHVVYGGLRVLVGALAALILYLGFRSGVVNGILQPVTGGYGASWDAPQTLSQPLNIYWLAFVCVLAGFSEQLVPNLLDAQARKAMGGENGNGEGDGQQDEGKQDDK